MLCYVKLAFYKC